MKKIVLGILVLLFSFSLIWCVSAKAKSFKKLKPTVINYGYHYNGEDIEQNLGAKLKGGKKYKNIKFVYYHKDGKKFRKIATKKAKGIKSRKLNLETVDHGCIHEYKVKAYIKVGKKKIYSKMSKIKKVFIPRCIAKYKVECLTPAGVYNTKKLDIVFKITSASKYNGLTIFDDYNLDNFDFEEYRQSCTYPNPDDPSKMVFYFDRSLPTYTSYMKWGDEKEFTEHTYFVGLKEYSLDRSAWNKLTNDGIKLKAGKSLYLKATIYDEYTQEGKIYFAGNNKDYRESYFELKEGFFKYKTPFRGDLFGGLNFLTGEGSANYDDD